MENIKIGTKKQDVKRKSRRRDRTHPVFIHNAYTRDGFSDESFPRMVTLHDRLDTKWLLARTHYLAFAGLLRAGCNEMDEGM